MPCPICRLTVHNELQICLGCLNAEPKEDRIEDLFSYFSQEYSIDKQPFFPDRNQLTDWLVSKSGRAWHILRKYGITLPKVEKHLGIDMVGNRAIAAKESYEKSNEQEWRLFRELSEIGVLNLQWDGRVSHAHKRRIDFLFFVPSRQQWWGVDCFDHTGEAAIKAEIKKKIARGYQNSVHVLWLIIPDGVPIPFIDNLPEKINIATESALLHAARICFAKH